MKYIIDGHFDLLSDVAVRRKNGEHKVIERLYYPAFKKGNVTGIVASLFVDSQYLPYGSVSIALEQIAALHCEISESPELLMLCTSADDFGKAALEKRQCCAGASAEKLSRSAAHHLSRHADSG